MNIHNYGKITSGRDKKLKRRIKGIIIVLLIVFAGAFIIGILTDDGPEYQKRSSALKENHALKEQIIQLQNEVSELQNQVSSLEEMLGEKDAYINSLPTEEPTEDVQGNFTQSSPRSE